MTIHGESEKTILNIPYLEPGVATEPQGQQYCVLDLFLPESQPENRQKFVTVIYIHGGGMVGCTKEEGTADWCLKTIKDQGHCVVLPEYRKYYSPDHPYDPADCVSCRTVIADAAAAVAWVFKNIHRYGGDPSRIFVTGHSAGAYITAMIGLDKQWLGAHGIDANQIAGIMCNDGAMMTHPTVRKERGIPATQAMVDEMAPLFHARVDAPPLLLVTGDRNNLFGQYFEQNLLLSRWMTDVIGHKETKIFELQGYPHNPIPAIPLFLYEIDRILAKKKSNSP